MAVVAAPASFSVMHDQPLLVDASVGVLPHASTDGGNPLSAVLVNGPLHGSLNLLADGRVDYTPSPGYFGPDAFTFEGFDGNDTSDPTTASISVTDQAPQVQANAFGVLKGQDFSGILASFTDADNPNATFAATIDFGDGQTASANVSANGQGGFDVSAGHNYAAAGAYQLSVTVVDPLGVSGTATASITVLPQYDYTYTDPVGNQTQFTYGGNWQLKQEIDPLGHATSFTYTDQNQLATRIDRLGREIDYAYNAGGQITAETWRRADATVADTLAFDYDSAGDLLTASNQNGTYTFGYQAGQLVSVTEPFGVSLTFGYDSSGNRTSVQDSLGGLTSSIYSGTQLASRQFTDGQNALNIGLAYNTDGTLASINRFSDLAGTQLAASTAYAYAQGQIASITHANAAGNVIDFFNYQFDAAGHITSVTSASAPTSTYTYDAQGQIASDGANTFGFDANGSRTGSGYVVGPANQLLSDGVWNYSYDAESNLAGKVNIASGETWTYGYDNINHLTHVEQRAADGTLLMQADYKYDAFSNRIEKDVWTAAQGTVVTRFALDGFNNGKPTPVGNENWDVWAELDGNNNLQTRYVNGDSFNQVFARIDSNGVAWLLTDNLGSVRDVVNNDGTVLDQIAYGSFGNITYELNPTYGGNVLFTSDQYDAETGLYFSRARYLDPFAGRWTTEDPMGFSAGDSNLYRYVSNDPANNVDPSGLDRIEVRGPGVFWIVTRPTTFSWRNDTVSEFQIGMRHDNGVQLIQDAINFPASSRPGNNVFSLAEIERLASYDNDISGRSASFQLQYIDHRLAALTSSLPQNRARVVPQEILQGFWSGVRDGLFAVGDAGTAWKLPGAEDREMQFRRDYGDGTWNTTTFIGIGGIAVGGPAVLAKLYLLAGGAPGPVVAGAPAIGGAPPVAQAVGVVVALPNVQPVVPLMAPIVPPLPVAPPIPPILLPNVQPALPRVGPVQPPPPVAPPVPPGGAVIQIGAGIGAVGIVGVAIGVGVALGPPVAAPPLAAPGIAPLANPLSQSGALRNAAVEVHNLAATATSRIGVNMSTVSIVEATLPNGTRQLFASGSGARLTPAQVNRLVELGVPRENIFSGVASRLTGATAEETRLLNHAERVILRNLPEGARVNRWGISWGGQQRAIPCDVCEPFVNQAGGVVEGR